MPNFLFLLCSKNLTATCPNCAYVNTSSSCSIHSEHSSRSLSSSGFKRSAGRQSIAFSSPIIFFLNSGSIGTGVFHIHL